MYTSPGEEAELLKTRTDAHSCNEACGLVEEASNVLVYIVIDLDGHVGEVPLVEARDNGRGIQDVRDASLLEAL